MKRLSLVLLVVFLVGCGSNLPTENSGENRKGFKDVTIRFSIRYSPPFHPDLTVVFSGAPVKSPKLGSNITGVWNMVDMAKVSDSIATYTFITPSPGDYIFNIEYSSRKWAAWMDSAGLHLTGTVIANEEVFNKNDLEPNGFGGANILLNIPEPEERDTIPVDSPKLGSDITGVWNMVNMTKVSDSVATYTFKNPIPDEYVLNIEYFPEEWVAWADSIGTIQVTGTVTANNEILKRTKKNGQGGANFLIRINKDGKCE